MCVSFIQNIHFSWSRSSRCCRYPDIPNIFTFPGQYLWAEIAIMLGCYWSCCGTSSISIPSSLMCWSSRAHLGGHHTEDSSRKTHIPGVSRSLSRVTDAHDNESVLQKFWLTPDLSGPFVSGFQVHGGKQFYNCVRSKLLCRLRWPCFLKSVKYSLVFLIVWSMGQSLSAVRYISAATLPLGSWQPGFDEVTWSEPCSQPSCVSVLHCNWCYWCTCTLFKNKRPPTLWTK